MQNNFPAHSSHIFVKEFSGYPVILPPFASNANLTECFDLIFSMFLYFEQRFVPSSEHENVNENQALLDNQSFFESLNENERVKSFKNASQEMWKYISPLLMAGIDSFTLLSIIDTIAAGYPSAYLPVIRATCKYVIPPVAILGATNEILNQQEIFHNIATRIADKRIEKTTLLLPIELEAIRKQEYARWEKVQHIIEGVFNGLSISSFLMVFTFFIYSQIIELEEKNTNPVDIANWKAWFIISTCLVLGGLESLNTYYKAQENNLDFQTMAKMQKILCFISTNKISRWALAFLDGSTSIHSFYLCILNLTARPIGGLEQYFRYGLTAVSGLFTMIVLGSTKKNSQNFKIAVATEKSLEVIKAISLGLTGNDAFNTPQAVTIWGQENLNIQKYLWLSIFSYIFTVSTLFLLAKNKNIQNFANKFFTRRSTSSEVNSFVLNQESSEVIAIDSDSFLSEPAQTCATFLPSFNAFKSNNNSNIVEEENFCQTFRKQCAIL